MKSVGWFAIFLAVVVFAVAAITAIGNIRAAYNNFDQTPQSSFPWQAQVGCEMLVALLFFIPGVIAATHKPRI